MVCKNIECDKETMGKRIYCSLTCRNYYINKYLRNYDKYKETCKSKKLEKENHYLTGPKLCLFCEGVISYDKRLNDYCGMSCRAKHTNGKRDYSLWSDNIKKGRHDYLIKNGIVSDYSMIGKKEKICKGCEKSFITESRKIYCTDECKKNYKRIDLDLYQLYRVDTKFKFNLADYPDEFDFSLIEEYGWYSPSNKNDNLGGVSRDHMLSVREGFELGISSEVLSHPANCKLMIHSENISKNYRSSLTVDELLGRIRVWDEKYK